jgi:hypothetical protein
VRLDPLVLRTALRLLCVLSLTEACTPRADVGAAEGESAGPLSAITLSSEPIVGDLGTAHPVTIQGISPTGHWLAICQARADTDGDGKIEVMIGEHGEARGDELRTYLVRAAGPGEPIDAFVGSDPTGRHVAFVKEGGRLALLDTWRGGELEIPRADVADDPNPLGPHRAVSFDAGHHAAWAEQVGSTSRIVVRDLDDGSQRHIEVGSAPLWRFQLHSSGRWLWAWTIEKDTDGNGKLEIPHATTTLGDRFCRGEVSVSSHHGWQGDHVTRKVALVEDGAVLQPAADAIGILAGALLLRKPDSSIVRRSDDGEHVLVPAECAGRIVHSDDPSESLWVACMADPGATAHQGPLHRYGFEAHEDMHLTVRVEEYDVWTASDPHLYTVEKVFVNPTTGTVGRRIGKSTHLFWEDGVLFDASQRASDVDRAPVLDEVHGLPIAVLPSGEMLVAARNEGFGAAVQGPLRWVAPQ